MSSRDPESHRHRDDIDGLRAIAVLAVIFNHSVWKTPPSGFLGVDVFFVISGFVITASLQRRPSGWGTYLSAFYARRLRRLAPALIVCVLGTAIAARVVLAAPAASLRTGVSALFAASNFYLLKQQTNYFAGPATLNLFTHTWSLGVEEQFYFAFPAALRIFGLTGDPKQESKRRGVWLLSFLVLGSAVVFERYSHTHRMVAFFMMPMRFWELGLGCLALLASRLWRDLVASTAAAAASLAAIAICLMLPDSFATEATLIVAFATAVLLGSASRAPAVTRMLSTTPLVYIGKISYSLYLWHWPVVSLARHLALHGAWLVPSQLAVMLILASASYRFVEQPLRQRTWASTNARTIGYGAVASGAAAALVVALSAPPAARLSLAHPQVVGGNFLEADKCHLPTAPDPVAACLAPRTERRHRAFVMGDSHAGTIVPGLEAAAPDDWEVRHLTDSALANHLLGSNDCSGVPCSGALVDERATFLASNMRHGDLLVFALSRDRLYSVDVIGRPDRELAELAAPRARTLRERLPRLVGAAIGAGGRVILVEDLPKPCREEEFEVWNDGHGGRCELGRRESLSLRAPLSAVYEELSTSSTKVSVVDLHDTLCPTNMCGPIVEGAVIFVDASPHLTLPGSRALEPTFRPSFP